MIKKHIPNIITLTSLFVGCIGVVAGFVGEFHILFGCVIASGILDFLDGFAARMLKAYSPIGKDLDSLADLIAFGMAPAAGLFALLTSYHTLCSWIGQTVSYSAFLLVVFSALRLAKFNNDTRQSDTFIGLATPANALFWVSVVYGSEKILSACGEVGLFLLIGTIGLFCYLMVAEIPMFSLKKRSLKSIQGNWDLILLIAVIALSVCILGVLGIAVSVLFYVGISIFTSKIVKE